MLRYNCNSKLSVMITQFISEITSRKVIYFCIRAFVASLSKSQDVFDTCNTNDCNIIVHCHRIIMLAFVMIVDSEFFFFKTLKHLDLLVICTRHLSIK